MRAFLIALMLMAGTSPAIAKHIPCMMVKYAILMIGSEEGAEKEALARGYTREQIAAARKRCLGK